jgi:hypothetical protein
MQHLKTSHKPIRRKKKQVILPAQTQPGIAQIKLTEKRENLSQNEILQLQRQIGNAAVIRLLKANDNPPPLPTANAQRLPEDLNTPLQTMFGDTAQNARLHTDAQADHIARAKNSDAVSVGSNIYFRSGAYRPGTATGNALIAREMTHIAQRQHEGASTTPSLGQQQDAETISGLVQEMGSSPASVLQRTPHQNITPTQKRVIQRLDKVTTSKARTAGIVVSKTVQGIANGLLGPIGVIWRWPLIRKNMREYLGATGKQQDVDRYGKTKWGDVAAAISATHEILKEFTIWLGFATFLSAIVAAASYGAGAAVFAVLSVLTAFCAGLMFLMKGYLVGHNLVRLIKANRAVAGSGNEKDENRAREKRRMIKHQLWTDGMDGVSALVSTITGALGGTSAMMKLDGVTAGFSGSPGSAISGALGQGGVAKPIVGKIIGDTLTSPGIGLVTNTLKEGGKESTKQGKGGFKDGFLKDWNDIKLNWKDQNKKGFDWQQVEKPKTNTPSPQPETTNQQEMMEEEDTTSSSVDNKTVEDLQNKLSTLAGRGGELGSEQHQEESDAKTVTTTLQDQFGSFDEKTEGVNKLTTDLNKAGEGAKQVKQEDGKGIEAIEDENTYKKTKKDIQEGLKKSQETNIGSEESGETITEIPNTNDKDNKLINNKLDVQRGIGSRIKNWFKSKFGKLKVGLRRLNNKLMSGIFSFMSKFSKKGGDLKAAGGTIKEELQGAKQDEQDEKETSKQSGDFQGKAAQAALMFEQAKDME